jgi:putative CocE/NonD family hydrolase
MLKHLDTSSLAAAAMMVAAAALVAAPLVGGPAAPVLAAPPLPAAPSAVKVRMLVKVQMRDGVRLNATLYLPPPPAPSTPAREPPAAGEPPAARFPVIFRLSPNTPDSFHREALYLARRGFAYAAVEARGRGSSEGRFDFYVNDGRDGHDTVEWLARQPWSNGKVGMWGESYCGRAVWSTLKEHPPHLASAVPISAGHPIRFWNNLIAPDVIDGMLYLAGTTVQANLALDPEFLPGKYKELYLRHLPLRQLDRLVGSPSERFQAILDHPTPDAFWESVTPGADDYRRLELPLLTITGTYDFGHEPSALDYYGQHLRHAPPAGRERHYLVIGPWDHGGTFRPRREVAGLVFDAASAIDMPALLAGWFGHTLRGEPLPPLLGKRVACYVAGAEQWRHADTLEALSGAAERLYLASDGHASNVFHSGRLMSDSTGAAADHWVYDPLDVTPAEDEPAENESWATDQRPALALHGDGVVYHGEPLPADVEVIGEPRLSLALAMDVPDTDLLANLYLIAPSGGSVLLGEAALRARYRHSLEKEELVRPGEIDRYELTFPFLARRLPRGSRVRLLVRSPNSIYREKNYNSGRPVADESGRDARTAHLTLYHDPAHPSWLELPQGLAR